MIDLLTKGTTVDVWQGFKYASDIYCDNSHQRIIEKEKLD